MRFSVANVYVIFAAVTFDEKEILIIAGEYANAALYDAMAPLVLIIHMCAGLIVGGIAWH